MASSIILHQSGDSIYENSGEKLNNKAGCDIAAFGGRDNLHGSIKKSVNPVAAVFLRIPNTTAEELYVVYKKKQFYRRLIELICLHPIPATVLESDVVIAIARKSKRRSGIRRTYNQRQTKCSR